MPTNTPRKIEERKKKFFKNYRRSKYSPKGRKAVVKLSIPIIVAMSVQTHPNSLTDTFWVAGLGADALAAVGFAFPLFRWRLLAGWGVGGGSAISRRIGAER